MANRMIVQRITRLTLVRKGKGQAKHPDLRGSVVEAVKAAPLPKAPTEGVLSEPMRRNLSGRWQ